MAPGAAFGAINLTLDGITYSSLASAVYDTDDNELRVDSGLDLTCDGFTPDPAAEPRLDLDGNADIPLAGSVSFERDKTDTVITATTNSGEVLCGVEQTIFQNGFEDPPPQ